jgi:hypothetical protein
LDDIHEALGQKTVGTEVQSTIIRGGQKLQISIRIGERPVR